MEPCLNMEHQSIKQRCLQILSQAVDLTLESPDEGDGQTWFAVNDTMLQLGVAESSDGEVIAILVCGNRPPGEQPVAQGIANDVGFLPELFAGESPDWKLVSDEHLSLHVKGDTGEAVAIRRLISADFERADKAATLTDWVRRAVAALR